MGLMEKIFGDPGEKQIKKIDAEVEAVLALEPEMQALSDEELRAKTAEFRKRYEEGESLDDMMVEAFAVCREAAWRSLGMKHFKVQLIGGVVLHRGDIAEMKTGEGKTLVATLAAYLNAIPGKGVHVVTVNDYLAKRDAEWMGKLYSFLGLTVGCVVHGITNEQRRQAYMADITYGTNNEFGFDYLRDNMVIYSKDLMQRELNYAIVDEVDSILIDEARTPLIISGPGAKSTDLYQTADRFVMSLKPAVDFEMDEKEKTIALTEDGVRACEKFFGVENFSDPENMEINHHVIQALKARHIMKRDVDYIVRDGEIVIVDEFTGRFMFGRRYSNGLHQAIEAKEGVLVRSESKTLATITLQNYFRMYQKLAGMTGTAKTEEEEFREIYNMDVLVIPTNRPIARVDADDAIYSTEEGKFKALADKIKEVHETGQPVLVGTISVEKSEYVSELLKKRGVKHNVLNAKQHEREAEIVAEAGREGAVTIATNMAGRGTDIILGGNPDFEAKREMKKLGFTEEQISFATGFAATDDAELIEARKKYQELLAQFKAERAPEQEKVRALGGLCILGTERHESRRIDNQLRGRAGRQGDPGYTQFYLSMEDDLLRLFGGERLQGVASKLGMGEGDELKAGMLSRTVENAQKKVEGRNFSIRKYVLQYDNVMNKQREIIYDERRKVLFGEDLHDYIHNMMEELVENIVASGTAGYKYAEEWDFDHMNSAALRLCGAYRAKVYSEDELQELTPEALTGDMLEQFAELYDAKEAEIGADKMREIERMILLRVVDNKWMDHIDAMDQLKTGIGLRAMGQIDPAQAYAQEGFDMFEEMIGDIKEDTVKFCYNVTIATGTERKEIIGAGEGHKDEFVDRGGQTGSGLPIQGPVGMAAPMGGAQGGMPQAQQIPPRQQKPVTFRREAPKVGRNDPCPCGSGKKYKNCCGREG